MKTTIITLIMFISPVLSAQGRQTSDTKGNCNGTATGSNITVTVRCEEGLTAEQSSALANQYASILRAIKQGDTSQNSHFEEMMVYLKSIKSGISSLQSAAKGRHLTADQIRELSVAGKDFANQPGVLKFDYYGTDPEVAAYARDFMTALEIDPQNAGFTAMTSHPVTGVRFAVSQADYLSHDIPPICNGFKALLDRNKIPIVPVAAPRVPSGHCELLIGYKPTL